MDDSRVLLLPARIIWASLSIPSGQKYVPDLQISQAKLTIDDLDRFLFGGLIKPPQ